MSGAKLTQMWASNYFEPNKNVAKEEEEEDKRSKLSVFIDGSKYTGVHWFELHHLNLQYEE